MFKELVSQVKKLFSSKSNGGRLVYKLTDQLHYYKQVLLATSIVLLLGYSQFRAHFSCSGNGRLDGSVLTNFCWINGTTTINLIDRNAKRGSKFGAVLSEAGGAVSVLPAS